MMSSSAELQLIGGRLDRGLEFEGIPLVIVFE